MKDNRSITNIDLSQDIIRVINIPLSQKEYLDAINRKTLTRIGIIGYGKLIEVQQNYRPDLQIKFSKHL